MPCIHRPSFIMFMAMPAAGPARARPGSNTRCCWLAGRLLGRRRPHAMRPLFLCPPLVPSPAPLFVAVALLAGPRSSPHLQRSLCVLRAACDGKRQRREQRTARRPSRSASAIVSPRQPPPPNPRRCDRQLDSPSLKSRLSQNNALCIPDATRREEAGAASRLQSQESPRSGRRSPSPPRKTAQRRQSGRPMNKSLTAATSTPYSSHPPV